MWTWSLPWHKVLNAVVAELGIYIYIYIYIYIKRNCARSLEYSSASTLAGLSYHICGKLEVAFKASPSSQHQHCTDEAQMCACLTRFGVL